MNLHLLLLTLCQGFLLINNVTFIAINGLVGLALAPSPWLATLPVTAYVTGGALSAGMVARHQRAWGRRRTFQLGLRRHRHHGPVRMGRVRAQLLDRRSRHAVRGLLRRQRRSLSLRCHRDRGAGLQGARDLVGAGRRDPRRRGRPEPRQAHTRAARDPVRRRLPGAGGHRPARPPHLAVHPLSALALAERSAARTAARGPCQRSLSSSWRWRRARSATA